MKPAILILAFASFGVVLLLRAAPHPEASNISVVPKRELSADSEIAGTVLAAPYQVVRTPVGGRVVRVYFNEGQAVQAGALLLKLAVGRGQAARTVFAAGPVAGNISNGKVSPGQYLAAGTPYARLTPRGPVRVRVANADAARLRPGDSLRVLTGPVGLVGVTTPLTALFPDLARQTVVLVFGRLGWPPGTAVKVVLTPIKPLSGPGLSATD